MKKRVKAVASFSFDISNEQSYNFIIALLNRYSKVAKEVLYWFTLEVMLLIGATIGNYISKPAGLNFGNIWTSLTLVILFVLLFYQSNKQLK